MRFAASRGSMVVESGYVEGGNFDDDDQGRRG
jgi:hypothetical protein